MTTSMNSASFAMASKVSRERQAATSTLPLIHPGIVVIFLCEMKYSLQTEVKVELLCGRGKFSIGNRIGQGALLRNQRLNVGG